MSWEQWKTTLQRSDIGLKRNPNDSSSGSVHTWFTREGWYVLFILLFILIGAALRSVNLLVLLASLIAGMLIIQWRICRRSLTSLSIRRRLPMTPQANLPFEVSIEVHNRNPYLPSWLISLEERLVRVEPSTSNQPTGTTMVVPWIGATMSASARFQCQLKLRGKYRFGPTRLTTAFPFGLMRGWVTAPQTAELIVRPQLGQLTGKWQNLIRLERQGLAKTASRAGVNEGEFYGLRTWQHGDSQRWIHWRTTARLNELAVRQFEQQQKLSLAILIDLWIADENKSREGNDPTIEKIICFTASLLDSMCRQGNHHLAIAIAGNNLRVSTRIQSRAVLGGVLDDLAVVAPSSTPNLPGAVEQLLPILADSRALLVVSSRDPNWQQLQPNLRGESQRAIMDKVQSRWLNVARGEIDPFFKMEEL